MGKQDNVLFANVKPSRRMMEHGKVEFNLKPTSPVNTKQPNLNLHHNYTSIGTYYKNLSKKKKVSQIGKEEEFENKEMVAEVISGEDLSERDEDNFYVQMRNNL